MRYKLKNKSKSNNVAKEKNKKTKVNAASAAGMDSSTEYEVLFCTANVQKEQMFPDNMVLLSDPNIWIADSAATADMTFSNYGLKNSITAK